MEPVRAAVRSRQELRRDCECRDHFSVLPHSDRFVDGPHSAAAPLRLRRFRRAIGVAGAARCESLVSTAGWSWTKRQRQRPTDDVAPFGFRAVVVRPASRTFGQRRVVDISFRPERFFVVIIASSSRPINVASLLLAFPSHRRSRTADDPQDRVGSVDVPRSVGPAGRCCGVPARATDHLSVPRWRSNGVRGRPAVLFGRFLGAGPQRNRVGVGVRVRGGSGRMAASVDDDRLK